MLFNPLLCSSNPNQTHTNTHKTSRQQVPNQKHDDITIDCVSETKMSSMTELKPRFDEEGCVWMNWSFTYHLKKLDTVDESVSEEGRFKIID